MTDSLLFSKKRWYVFYTYPNAERKIYNQLLFRGFEAFLPLHWVIKHWSDRNKRLLIPLFPSYIFVNIERSEIYEILKTPKLIRCVTFNGTPAFLKQKEFDNIKQIAENKYPFEVSSNLNIGDFVVITEGVLMGMEGTLVEVRGNHRFAVKIEALQQFLLVNVPSDCMKYLDNKVLINN